MLMNPCCVDKEYARVRGKTRHAVGEVEPEYRNRRTMACYSVLPDLVVFAGQVQQPTFDPVRKVLLYARGHVD